MAILSGLYVLVALSFFGTLFKGFKKSTDLSPEQRECALKVMSLAAIFWPVVAPISYLEKRSKSKQVFYQPKIEKSQEPVVPEFEMNQVLIVSEFEIKSETQKQQKELSSSHV